MDYYLLSDGAQIGPFSADDVRARVQRGEARAADLAWHAGAADWAPLGTLLDLPASDPATPRQRAFLAFMGVTAPEQATRQEAAMLVNDAMEKDPSRLARWNEERLQLHPELFSEEIQARKEGRVERFFEICQREGVRWFERVAKAHCQVLIAHLDVQSPHWDAHEHEATNKHFFPALALKFPQLLTAEGRAHFKQEDARRRSETRRHRSASSTGPLRPTVGQVVFALGRGTIYGALILAALWFGRDYLPLSEDPLASAPPAPPAVATPTPAEPLASTVVALPAPSTEAAAAPVAASTTEAAAQ